MQQSGKLVSKVTAENLRVETDRIGLRLKSTQPDVTGVCLNTSDVCVNNVLNTVYEGRSKSLGTWH